MPAIEQSRPSERTALWRPRARWLNLRTSSAPRSSRSWVSCTGVVTHIQGPCRASPCSHPSGALEAREQLRSQVVDRERPEGVVIRWVRARDATSTCLGTRGRGGRRCSRRGVDAAARSSGGAVAQGGCDGGVSSSSEIDGGMGSAWASGLSRYAWMASWMFCSACARWRTSTLNEAGASRRVWCHPRARIVPARCGL